MDPLRNDDNAFDPLNSTRPPTGGVDVIGEADTLINRGCSGGRVPIRRDEESPNCTRAAKTAR